MAEETKAQDSSSGTTAKVAVPAEAGAVKEKKLRPTNCAQSNKRIRRKDWYYRDGKFFANKQCFKLFAEQEAEKVEKAKAEQAAKTVASAPVEGEKLAGE